MEIHGKKSSESEKNAKCYRIERNIEKQNFHFTKSHCVKTPCPDDTPQCQSETTKLVYVPKKDEKSLIEIKRI